MLLQILLVISIVLLPTTLRRAPLRTRIGRDLEALDIDLLRGAPVLLVVRKTLLQLTNLVNTALILSTVVLNEFVQTDIARSHLQALLAPALARVRCLIIVIDATRVSANWRLTLSLLLLRSTGVLAEILLAPAEHFLRRATLFLD